MKATLHQQLSIFQKTMPYGSVFLPGSEAYHTAIAVDNIRYCRASPAAVVKALTEQDVIETVLFARLSGIGLTVKSGGHSAAGYCVDTNGIVLDLSSMCGVCIDTENMQATIQGGSRWDHAYGLMEAGYMLVGGQCGSVGVSGYILGGGVSAFSRCYGMAIDNLLEVTMITAKGEKVTVGSGAADPVSRDLFWALRGGGGGNFGVVTETKVGLHRLRNADGVVVCGELTWNLPEQADAFNAMMQVWNSNTWPNELCGNGAWQYESCSSGRHHLLGQMQIIYNGTMGQCCKDIAPLLAFNPKVDLKSMHWSEWVYRIASSKVSSRVNRHHASFILKQGAITPDLVDSISSLMQDARDRGLIRASPMSECVIIWDHIGGATTEYSACDTAFPWRQGVYVAAATALWADPSMEAPMVEWVNDAKAKLRTHALDGLAAYVNYIDPTLTDWEEAYYGGNYARLQKVKSQWDPTGVFRFKQGIQPV
ncbi:Berberine and berberine like protein [Aspergillus sclerotialis]|uniref:Berberine and berberine like protein n=1 Tax=Aspergillus sclerotialis TaxID=2070753 RepID=A0A3A2ZW18_9EURO|nr:Berberine and berberine like protein [Aspergillus sclerotialis]